MRLGLCCTFLEQPIHFRRTTARYLSPLAEDERSAFLRALLGDNAAALRSALEWCAAHGVGAFRLSSQIFPVYTHPEVGYRLESLDPSGEIRAAYLRAGALARRLGIRLSLHPDPFVVLGSSSEEVVQKSVEEIEYHAEVAALVGAAQLTIHGGGAQGGKEEALVRLRRGLAQLRPRTRALLVLENDDKIYTVADLLPLCRQEGIPLVYDVHHHRCNPDGLGEEEAAEACFATWGEREPWAHVSSPRDGWEGPKPRLHADYIDPDDFPKSWLGRTLTVDVEAKAKELAVLKLARDLGLGTGPALLGVD